MKKLLYFILPLLAIALHGCDPLDDTYTDLEKNPTINKEIFNYTLLGTDYKLLNSKSAPYASANFVSADSANAYIPTILDKKFVLKDNGSVVNVTYTSAPVTFKAADSTFNNVAYTVVNPTDYTNSATVTGTSYKDYSAAQVLLFLKWKYPNAVANQLSVLTYIYYQSGVTPSAGLTVTDSFIFLNGAWQKIYTVSPTQYASVFRSNNSSFTSADNAFLPAWFNTFLSGDATIMGAAKKGDVIYVSYKYYYNTTVSYQRVLPLTYDGTKWVNTSATLYTLTFLKKNGTWIPDPTIYYALASADYTTISTLPFGSDLARANLAQYKNFNISATGTTVWSNTDIQRALAGFLKLKYTSPQEEDAYKITYYAYKGSYSYPSMKFVYTGGEFVFQSE